MWFATIRDRHRVPLCVTFVIGTYLSSTLRTSVTVLWKRRSSNKKDAKRQPSYKEDHIVGRPPSGESREPVLHGD